MTGSGYTPTEGWNLQLQGRIDALEQENEQLRLAMLSLNSQVMAAQCEVAELRNLRQRLLEAEGAVKELEWRNTNQAATIQFQLLALESAQSALEDVTPFAADRGLAAVNGQTREAACERAWAVLQARAALSNGSDHEGDGR